jgi:hypothetical protein
MMISSAPASFFPAGFAARPVVATNISPNAGSNPANDNNFASSRVETGNKAAPPGSAGARSGGSEEGRRSSEALTTELDEAELKQLEQLKARDREVRAHESAHQAVGGQYAGAISYTFQRGPDGAQYAVGGEVSISLTPVEGNPAATIEKMRTVRAAALAPAEPSSQDRAVAAEATQIMLQAQTQKATNENDSQDSDGGEAVEPRVLSRSDEASQSYRAIAGFTDPSGPADAQGFGFRASA